MTVEQLIIKLKKIKNKKLKVKVWGTIFDDGSGVISIYDKDTKEDHDIDIE